MSPKENESNSEFALRLQNELTRLELEFDPIEANAAGMKLPEDEAASSAKSGIDPRGQKPSVIAL